MENEPISPEQQQWEEDNIKWDKYMKDGQQLEELKQLWVRETLTRHVTCWKRHYFFECPHCNNGHPTVYYVPFENAAICSFCLHEYTGYELAQALAKTESNEKPQMEGEGNE
jgi:hypothetical protein